MTKPMSDHKFKVGDMVTTKPMKITTVSNIDRESPGRPENIFYQLENTSIHHACDLIPIPATDADVVEQVAAAIADCPLDSDLMAQAAIAALTSSGYTRSPKPVNQMLEALKRAKEFAIEWRGHIDDAGHIDASDEIEETISAAIAAAIAHESSTPPQPDANQMMLEALKDAKDCIEAWSSYASDYFKEKHDLKGDLARIDAAIAAGSEE